MKGERSNAQLPRDLRFEHLPMGVYIADREGHLLECNPAARRLLGLQESDPIEGRIQDFHAEAAGFEALAKTAVRAGKQGDGFEKASAHLSVGGRDVFAEQYLKAILSVRMAVSSATSAASSTSRAITWPPSKARRYAARSRNSPSTSVASCTPTPRRSSW